jgi:hypothetical protein
MEKRRRRALTDAERLMIRKRNKSHPLAQQQDLADWFAQETGHRITQGMVSTVLSNTFDYLDNIEKKRDKEALKNKMRFSAGDWPELEAALFEWQQRMEAKKAIITGDILKEKAHQLWQALPQFKHEQEPRWSTGWLDGFKKRFKIKEYVQHGEAASADINNPENLAQMERLRQLCKEYESRNILNMDETGMNWKRTPDRTLATKAYAGTKKSKDRITIALTSNADGSERFPPWVIGRSKNPRCFAKIKRRNLRIEYRFNKTKWMTGFICEEYLQWLNNKMRGESRKVLLLMDNFSGHELGVQLVGGQQGLSNVRIEWLPPNTTSFWQPMDQGIIASFKLQYRRQWVTFMLHQYEVNKNPQKTVNLLKAIQWTRVAWEQSVTSTTIQKCWHKSTLISIPSTNEPSQQDNDLNAQAELAQQIALLPINDPLPLHEFINPEDENTVDESSDIFEAVVQCYSVDKEDEEDTDSSEDEVEDIKTTVALQCLEQLKLWKLQKGNSQDIQALDRIGREILQYKSSVATQTTLQKFFKPID